MGLTKVIDYFFGLGSLTYYVSKSINKMGSKGSKKGYQTLSVLKSAPLKTSKAALAKVRNAKAGRALMPKDIFKLKGFMVAGTDNACYKDD